MFISAKYIDEDKTRIFAIDDEGRETFLPSDCDVGTWLEYLANGGTIEPADDPVEPVPVEISDRQFFQQLAIAGLITEEEAYTYMQVGTLPQAFLDLIAQLPAANRFDAKMQLMANSFRRDNEYTAAFGAAWGMSEPQIDDLWIRASRL